MERVSSYVISIKLEESNGKYLLIQGYTGAIDIVKESIALKLENNDIAGLPEVTLQTLRSRGYITDRTKEEEVGYVERIAHALHKRDKILYKSFTWVVTYNEVI